MKKQIKVHSAASQMNAVFSLCYVYVVYFGLVQTRGGWKEAEEEQQQELRGVL